MIGSKCSIAVFGKPLFDHSEKLLAVFTLHVAIIDATDLAEIIDRAG